MRVRGSVVAGRRVTCAYVLAWVVDIQEVQGK